MTCKCAKHKEVEENSKLFKSSQQKSHFQPSFLRWAPVLTELKGCNVFTVKEAKQLRERSASVSSENIAQHLQHIETFYKFGMEKKKVTIIVWFVSSFDFQEVLKLFAYTI